MPAEVLERCPSPVRAAPKVDPRIAERGTHGLEVLDPRRRRVLRGIDAARRELGRAIGGARHDVDVERALEALVRLERFAVERRRAPGATLVDEYDVAILADIEEQRCEGSEIGRRLPWAPGQDEQRIGARTQRVRGQHRDGQRDLASPRLVAVFGYIERAALRGERKERPPAFGRRERTRRRPAVTAPGGSERESCGERSAEAKPPNHAVGW